MNMKGFLFAIISLSVAGTAISQDKIFKSNGEVIDVKIKSVERNMINYLRYNNLSGPEYTLPKSEVDKIKYQNGSEESFSNEMMPRYRSMVSRRLNDEPLKGKYKPNILAFAPIQMSENGVAGFGISYEHVLDENGIVAFYIPAMGVFNLNSSTDPNSGNVTNNSDAMFYVMPGIKLYPTGGYGLTKYAIGPSLVIAQGQKTNYTYDPVTYRDIASTQDHFIFGMMVNQSININPTPHLYIGAEFGLGYSYVNTLAGVETGTNTLVQFSFKLGYRY